MFDLNEGPVDRGFRLVLGVLFGALAVVGAGGTPLTAVAWIMAVIFFATAAVGFCPLYGVLGIDTARERVKG
jgi:hypothetical protein